MQQPLLHCPYCSWTTTRYNLHGRFSPKLAARRLRHHAQLHETALAPSDVHVRLKKRPVAA